MKPVRFSISLLAGVTVLLTSQAFADWSRFAAVTADNWDAFDPPLYYEKPLYDGETNSVQFTYSVGWKSVWLISSQQPLSPEQQDMRGRRWCGVSDSDGKVKYESEFCDTVEVIPSNVKYYPLDIVGHDEAIKSYGSHATRTSTISVKMDDTMSRYLYIDFAFSATDGGYYLSIDLNSFVPE